MAAQIHQFLCREDNYGVLIHDPQTGATASIDTPEVGKVREALKDTGWTLTHILITHHHDDHIDGLAELAKETGAKVIANSADRHRIPAISEETKPGAKVFCGLPHRFGDRHPRPYGGPYRLLFPAGEGGFCRGYPVHGRCGRMFEGDPAGFWGALVSLRSLPDETAVYCGHEYTASNIRFALAMDPDNAALKEQAKRVEALRAAGKPTVPSSIGVEKATNPFMRADDAGMKARLGMSDKSATEVFGELRKRKNTF